MLLATENSDVSDLLMLLTTENSDVSSAKSLVVDEMPSGRSLM